MDAWRRRREQRKKIRAANDAFRRDPSRLGRLMVTAGVNAMGPIFCAKAVLAVRHFSEFDGGNDPYNVHDFGKITIDGKEMFWKIDCYEKGIDYMAGAEHPENTATTDRVLTIMLVSEY